MSMAAFKQCCFGAFDPQTEVVFAANLPAACDDIFRGAVNKRRRAEFFIAQETDGNVLIGQPPRVTAP